MPKNKYNTFLSLLFVLFTSVIFSQNSIDETLEKYNSGSIPYIYVDELESKLENNEDLILLDSRSYEEYKVSHLKDANWIGYKDFELSKVKNVCKNTEIIIYCSVGVRSEKIGENLKTLGYMNIKNLYGGIFLWYNKGLPIYKDGEQTEKIHAYNRKWSRFIDKGKVVY